MKNKIQLCIISVVLILCRRLSKNEQTRILGDFPKMPTRPGGPLKFYAAFDGATSDPLMNAVDSVRANFPSENPLVSSSWYQR